MNTDAKTASILLIEDSEEDVFFFRRALARCGQDFPLTVAGDGKAALDILSSPEKRRQFDIIFLDLKLPLFHGFEVLRWLRDQESERPIPVYILSGSSQLDDKTRAAELGATGYLVKPITVAVLQELLPCVAMR